MLTTIFTRALKTHKMHDYNLQQFGRHEIDQIQQKKTPRTLWGGLDNLPLRSLCLANLGAILRLVCHRHLRGSPDQGTALEAPDGGRAIPPPPAICRRAPDHPHTSATNKATLGGFDLRALAPMQPSSPPNSMTSPPLPPLCEDPGPCTTKALAPAQCSQQIGGLQNRAGKKVIEIYEM